MGKTLKKSLITAGKLAIAAGLLWLVFRSAPWEKFASTLREANVLLMLCALGGYVLSLVIIAFRLRMLLQIQGISIRVWETVRLTFLGQFFNAVVPGVVGGDLVKAYYVAKHTDHKGAAVMTVFVDRLMGFLELVMLAAVMLVSVLVSGRANLAQMQRPALATAVAMTAVLGMLLFVMSPALRRMFRLQKIYRRLPFAQHIDSAGAAAREFRRRPMILVKAVAITLGAHATWIGGIALAGRSLSLDVPWYNYFLYIPLIYIIGSVPITPGGVGLVELFYKIFFVSAAVMEHQVLALMVVARVLDILRGLPGLVVALTGAKLPKREQLQAELAAANPSDSQ